MSIRHNILAAIAQDGATMDDICDRLNQPRKKLHDNVKSKLRGDKKPTTVDTETGEIQQPEAPTMDPDDEFLKALEQGS